MLLLNEFDPFFLIAAGIVLLFGMGWHEYAHALMATWWGDPTPREFGRLTPNPIVHINWIGWVMFLLLGFGILGSVPTTPRRMRDPRWGSFWTSFAGPLSNLIQAAIFAVAARVLIAVLPLTFWRDPLGDFVWTFLYVGVSFNVLLFVFNLLPLVIPGMLSPGMPFIAIDGWNMMYAALPARGMEYRNIPGFMRNNLRPLANFLAQPAQTWANWAQPLSYVFLAILLLGFVLPAQFNPLTWLIGRPTWQITAFLLGV